MRALLDATERADGRAARPILDRIWPPAKQGFTQPIELYFDAQDRDAQEGRRGPGFQTLTRQEASLFFRLASYRSQHGSRLLATNKSVKERPEILAGDEVTATALLDRLLHRNHVLNIRGRSYRLRVLEKMMK